MSENGMLRTVAGTAKSGLGSLSVCVRVRVCRFMYLIQTYTITAQQKNVRLSFVNRHVMQSDYTHSSYSLVGPLRMGVPDWFECLL